MIGTNSDRTFGLHGSETKNALRFALQLLSKHGLLLGAKYRPYLAGVEALNRILACIEDHPRVVPAPKQQAFVEDVHVHMQSLNALQIALKPKHHLLIEMAGRFFEGKKLKGASSGGVLKFRLKKHTKRCGRTARLAGQLAGGTSRTT